MEEKACPCGSGETYHICCSQYHNGIASAPTAERLMRSRYSAFAKALPDYLIKTLHPTKRSDTDRASLEQTIQTTKWLKLEILEADFGQENDTKGTVEFMAFFESGSIDVMRERSRFIKENNNWYYLDGEQRKPKLPGRNEPCWCGSGKKSKKCHGVLL